MHRSSRPVGLERPGVGSRGPLGIGEQAWIAAGSRRVEERPVRLLRRMREVAGEPVDEDRSAAVGDRKRVPPHPEREPEPQVRSEQRIRTLAGQVRRRTRHPDHECVERPVELGPPQLHRPQQRLCVRDRRRTAVRRGHRQLGPQRSEHVAPKQLRQRAVDETERRACDAFERGGVVWIAAQRARHLGVVEHERSPEQRHVPAEGALERDRQMPALRGGRLEQRVCARGSERVGP